MYIFETNAWMYKNKAKCLFDIFQQPNMNMSAIGNNAKRC